MGHEDSFVELVRVCVRACHLLKAVTEGRDVDNLSSPSKKGIEDLGRHVDPSQQFLLLTTSDIRIVCHIEFVVSERASCGHDLPEDHPEFTKECFIAWQMEMWEILRLFDVRSFQPIVATVSKPLQEDPGKGGVLGANELERHVWGTTGAELPAPASTMVRCRVSTSTPPPADLLPNVG